VVEKVTMVLVFQIWTFSFIDTEMKQSEDMFIVEVVFFRFGAVHVGASLFAHFVLMFCLQIIHKEIEISFWWNFTLF
jgi:hypothetical protein